MYKYGQWIREAKEIEREIVLSHIIGGQVRLLKQKVAI
jgi:hypothetical protein